MQTSSHEHLREVIARNAGAVISLPSAGMLRHYKTRFLAADEEGFWIEAPPGEKGLTDQLMAQQSKVGMSIKSSPNKIVFTTIIRQFLASMQINRETAVDALLMAWPDQLVSIQRRSDYRVTVPADTELSLHVWRIPEHHVLRDRPLPSTQLRVTLRDLSVGGMALIYTRNDNEPLPVVDQRLRITLEYERGNLLIDGRVRHFRETPSGQLRMGVQFRNLENDLDGRQTLAALTLLVGMLQRDEVRRHRLKAG